MNYRNFEHPTVKSIELIDKPFAFYFENDEIKFINWKND
jgi:hypothetical protein